MLAQLVDTHTHLGDAVFDEDRVAVLARARSVGVGSVIAVTETLEEVERLLELREGHPELRLAFGLYPTYLDMELAEEFVEVIREHRDAIVAIGEVGLDRWVVRDDNERELQRRIFERFIDLSLELDLPLNVHSRSAGHYAISVLLEKGARRVQLHAFDGRAAKARPAVEEGFYFSVPPSVVRSPQKQKLVRALPLDRLLLETDSPVLGPTREERNEPANVIVSLKAIAELKGLAEEEVWEAVTENTIRLYGERIVSD